MIAIFNRMVNRHVDPIEWFGDFRELLEPKLNVYELFIDDGYDSEITIVSAPDETTARCLAADEISDCYLERAKCKLLEGNKIELISRLQGG